MNPPMKGTITAFGFKKKTQEAPAVQAAPVSVVDAPASGKISLAKGGRINLEKRGAPIVIRNGWTAKGKDYDLKALVRYHDGRTVYVGAANSDEKLSTVEGAVRHSGDATRAGEVETLTVAWHADIASIAVSSYSARENGAGSFKKYGVYVEIQNGDQIVGISAEDASAADSSYTLCFGEITYGSKGQLAVTNLELYSAAGSEHRVGYKGDRVVMDIGPIGQMK